LTAGTVPLNRALSKLGILSRAEATMAIQAGRVAVNGRIVRNPHVPVVPERIRITVDDAARVRAGRRTIAFHKPRGVISTRRDPEGRSTIYDVLGPSARDLVPIGRLDLATSGLILLTTDTQLANWITDPANAVPRVYLVSVRGRIGNDAARRLVEGVDDRSETLRASAVKIRKASSRESHLTVELVEGKNREIRRLFDAIGYEVIRLKRVRVGGIELGSLAAGEWRRLSAGEIARAFPAARQRR
jgi:23S rRNA pseudouridine2605 synthase